MRDVRHWVYGQCWSDKGDDNYISIYQVLMSPSKYAKHIRRIRKADIKYPLIVVEDEYDMYGSILDGNHRFARMIMMKKRVVPIVYFTKKELERVWIKL